MNELLIRLFNVYINRVKSNNYHRSMGSAFTTSDIKEVAYNPKHREVLFVFTWGSQPIKINDLNLCEQEELIRFLLLKGDKLK